MTETSPDSNPEVRPSVLSAAIKQLRPHQWAKNVLLLAPLVFSGAFLDPLMVARTLIGVASFCAIASAGYVFNDYLDREADRAHPKKCKRPIASGALPESIALIEMFVLLALGFALAAWLGSAFTAIGITYLATTLLYSYYFKHIVVLDVMVLAIHYVWRVIAGVAAIGVASSPWLLLCTAFLALFVGFNKRRAEIRELGDKVATTRKNLVQYSERVLAELQSITTANAIVSYALYCILGAPTQAMILTLPFVLYGIFRYIYLVEQKGEGAAPDETLLRDGPMLATGMFYGATAIAVLLAKHYALIS